MDRRLTAFVHLVHPETLQIASFGPGDVVPDWAAELITNPAAWEGDEPGYDWATWEETRPNLSVDEAAVAAADAEMEDQETAMSANDAPRAPHGNAKAETWAAYAETIGVEVPEGASRDEIKAAVAAASQD